MVEVRRFTRLADAFAEGTEVHHVTLCFQVVFRNFNPCHETLRHSPAAAAGPIHNAMTASDIGDPIDARTERPQPHDSCKVRRQKGASACTAS
jgi:hypothetical protein